MSGPGIAVFGHRRPAQLRNVLESLRRQRVLDRVHVWVDGASHMPASAPEVNAVRALSRRFKVASWTNCHGHLGIEKLMLDALTAMCRRYEDIIVLEDDCFPAADAVEVFARELELVRGDAGIYSVYGCPFGVPGEGEGFERFQGWGWATTRTKLLPVLAQLKAMFMMSETDYLAWTARVLDELIRKKLDVTGPRDVTRVLERQFSWDSATALLTALLGQRHRRTPRQVVYNCGAGADAGHFIGDTDRYRGPPWNMIGADEVWQYFHRPLAQRFRGRRWFGLDELDRKLEPFVAQAQGSFVELGANDGLEQTNTLWLERRGWRGLLIEAVPEYAAACRRNRPLARVVNAACVSPAEAGGEVEVHSAGLMSLVDGAREPEAQEQWLQRAETVQGVRRERCRTPARTLSSILDEHSFGAVDLLSLDVEGYELRVLEGLDFARHAPRQILLEDSGVAGLQDFLLARGYTLLAVLAEREFTRDLLFARKD